MSSTTHPIIATEGWRWIVPLFCLALLSYHFYPWWWALPWLALSGLGLFLFRDPRRSIPSSPLAVVAPADGKIIRIEKQPDPFIQRTAIRIRLQVAGLASYSLRSPVEGRMEEARCQSSTLASGRSWRVLTDENDDVVVSIHGGMVLLRRYLAIRFGQRIGQGQRCGAAPLAAHIDVYLAENTEIQVQVGDKVIAGSDVLASLVHTDLTTAVTEK